LKLLCELKYLSVVHTVTLDVSQREPKLRSPSIMG